MQFQYIGQVSLAAALSAQRPGLILGFEPAVAVVTLGVRGQIHKDIVQLPAGVEVLQLDRGGQATLHNPGQLVIFPGLDVRPLGGARRWIEILSQASCGLGARLGTELRWDAGSPGLYEAASGGKVISLGVRLKRGISTHGLAINVHNQLADFGWIRPCGQATASMALLKTERPLPEIFSIWVEELKAEVDKSSKLAEFMKRSITDGSVGAVGSAFP